MRSIAYLFSYLILIVGVLAAPTTIEATPNLEVSLRETGKNTKDWHFGLVIHTPGTLDGKAIPVYEYVRDGSCLVYDDTRNGRTKPTNIAKSADELPVSAKLIPKDHEKDDATLLAAAKSHIQTGEKSYPVSDPNYKNCFDFAVDAVGRLHSAGYVSDGDYAKFTNYYNHEVQGRDKKTQKYHDKVRDYTAGHVVADINSEKPKGKGSGKK